MIRINLLPEEYRKVEKTPLSLFLLLVVGVVVVCLALIFYFVLAMRTGALDSQLSAKRAEKEKAQNDARRADELEAELASYNKRLYTIKSIRASRIYWSKKLDLLAKRTPKDVVWFASVKMEQKDPYSPDTKPEDIKDGGFLELQCYQRSNDSSILAHFRDGLQSDRLFYLDFSGMKAPEFRTTIWDEADETDPRMLWFQVIMYLKPQFIFVE